MEAVGSTTLERAGEPLETGPDWTAGELPRRVHLLGIGGAGVSGAARLLHMQGRRCTGHDRAPSAFLDDLAALGLAVEVGESRAELLPADAELVVRSAAVPESDPQVRAALERGVPVVTYAQLLGRLTHPSRLLAVAGTHGKTTTSWLLHHALRGLTEVFERSPLFAGDAERALGAWPGALIGGRCRLLETNAVAPEPQGWFALEACEYQRSFLELEPHAAGITNIEADHLDCYGSLGALVEAFGDFAARVAPRGLLVVGAHVPASVEARARCRTWRLGREVLTSNVVCDAEGARFDLTLPGLECLPVRTPLMGAFNVDNAAVALALALGGTGALSSVEEPRTARLGERLLRHERRLVAESDDPPARRWLGERAAQSLARFPGAGRRFEPWGEVGGVELIHDYAHHPTEVAATLEAARQRFGHRPIHVLFQPHQHERTGRFLEAFVEALAGADRVVLTPVYGARSAAAEGPSADASELARGLAARRVPVDVADDLESCVPLFARHLKARSVGLVLGAGHVDSIRHDLLATLALRSRAAGQSER
jgi:UDP-N-acetylmuramate--alanine ligase